MIIMLQQFVNRVKELKILETKFMENKKQLVIIYGRRRIGKTELIKKFIENKRYIYYLCTQDSIINNINELKLQFASVTGKAYFADLETDFYNLFKYFINEIKSEKIIIVLDEFPNLIDLFPGIVSVMQKIYDELMDKSSLYIILSGSSISMMEDELLSYKSPLYGRRTGSLELSTFGIREARYFYNINFEDLIKIYSIFGGIPFYLSLADKNLTVEENIINKIMTKGEILYEEPKILLKEEFREPRVYELILRYISIGYNTYGKLENATHLDKGNISKYLETLISVKLIDYIMPLNQKRRGIYEIKDYFMTFYYRFVYPNLSMLEIDQTDKVMALIRTDLNIYYGHAFEKIVIEMIKRGIVELPFMPTNVKRFWKKEVEIDAIAMNEDTGDICFIECKFSDNVDGLQIYHDLKYKSLSVDFRRSREYYMIVAKSYKTRSKEAINLDFQELDKLTSRIDK